MRDSIPSQSFAVHLRKDLLFFVFAVGASLVVGSVINILRPNPLPLRYEGKEARILREAGAGDTRKISEGLAPVREMSVEEYLTLRSRGAVTVLDARPEIFHRLGHIPGAWSLPRDTFGESYEAMRDHLERDKDALIVVYCASQTCKDGELVRNALITKGFRRVAILMGGWDAWIRSGGKKEVATP